MKGITSNRRVKNDVKDAVLLADLLRLGSLPEAWVGPPGLRELRELVRYRGKLIQIRSGLESQVHAVLAKEGVLPERVDMFGPGGQAQLDEMRLGACYRLRIDSLRDLIRALDEEIGGLEDLSHDVLRTTAATGRCRRSMVWAGPSRRSSWLRSVTSPGSPVLGSCARGRG